MFVLVSTSEADQSAGCQDGGGESSEDQRMGDAQIERGMCVCAFVYLVI